MTRETFEARLLEVAYKTDAVLAPPVVAFRVGCSIAEATHYLYEMSVEGVLDESYDGDGKPVFELPHRAEPTGEPLSWQASGTGTGSRLTPEVMMPGTAPLMVRHGGFPARIPGEKSVPGAAILAFLFGPLGMLYSTVGGALVMFIINLFMLAGTGGLGLLVSVPVGTIWAASAASSHNRSLRQTIQPQLPG